MKLVQRVLVLMCLGSSLSGCAIIYLIGVALMPEPRITELDVVWAEAGAVCRAAFEGEPGDWEFTGLESTHYTKASNSNLAERSNEVWRVPTDSPSFAVVEGAARAVFDFDNDGALDLVYTRGEAIFTAPATGAMRDAFESSRKPETTLAEMGFRVLHRRSVPNAVDVAIQRVDNVTYLLATGPGERANEESDFPKRRALTESRAPDFFGVREMELYRVEPGGTTRKVCTFRVVRRFPG